MGKGQSLQQIVLWKLDIPLQKNLTPYLIPYTKINSSWIKNQNLTLKAIKFLEEDIKENLHDTGDGNEFLAMTKT